MTRSRLLLAVLLGSALSSSASRDNLHHDDNGLTSSQVGETPVRVTSDADRDIAPPTDYNAGAPSTGDVTTAEAVGQEPSDSKSTIHTISNAEVAAAVVSPVAVMQEPSDTKSMDVIPNEDVPTAGVSADTESTVHIVSNEKGGTAEVSRVVADTKTATLMVPYEALPTGGLSTDHSKSTKNAVSNEKMTTAEMSLVVAVPEPSDTVRVVSKEKVTTSGIPPVAVLLEPSDTKSEVNMASKEKVTTSGIPPVAVLLESSDTKSEVNMASKEKVTTSGIPPVAVLLEPSDTKSKVHVELKAEQPPEEVSPVAAMPEPVGAKSTVLTTPFLGPEPVFGESSASDAGEPERLPAPVTSQSSDSHSKVETSSPVVQVVSSDVKLTTEEVPSTDRNSAIGKPSLITPESSDKKSAPVTPSNFLPDSSGKHSTLLTPESGEKTMEISVPTEEKAKDETKRLQVTPSYKGAQVLRLRGVTSKIKKMVADMEENGDVERWNVNVTSLDIMISESKVEEIKRAFEKESLDYEIIIADIQEAIDTENPKLSDDDMAELTGRKGHNMTWQMYHRMNDLHGYLDYLAATYPHMVTVQTIGYSHERKPLKVVKIVSGNPNAKKFWIDGGIHAREWISPAAVSYIISELVENYEAHRSTVQNVDFYILPMVNPDGYEYTHTYDRLWRKNRSHGYYCQGTDLNRNWGFHWGGPGSSRQPCKEIYAGKSAFSEPETRVVSNYIINNKENMKAFVTFHSYGQYILYPWGYDRKLPVDHQEMDRVGRIMAQAISSAGGPAYTVGSTAYVLYAASGGSDDWAKAVPKIKYSYTIELRDTGRYGFLLPSQFIKPVAKEALAAIKALASSIQSAP